MSRGKSNWPTRSSDSPARTRKSGRDICSAAYLTEAAIPKFKTRARRIGRYTRETVLLQKFVAICQPPKTRQFGSGASFQGHRTFRTHAGPLATHIEGG